MFTQYSLHIRPRKIMKKEETSRSGTTENPRLWYWPEMAVCLTIISSPKGGIFCGCPVPVYFILDMGGEGQIIYHFSSQVLTQWRWCIHMAHALEILHLQLDAMIRWEFKWSPLEKYCFMCVQVWTIAETFSTHQIVIFFSHLAIPLVISQSLVGSSG